MKTDRDETQIADENVELKQLLATLIGYIECGYSDPLPPDMKPTVERARELTADSDYWSVDQ